MPHISLPNLPGMVALAAYRPDVYARLASLADLLLHKEHASSSLSPGERELIATYVSALNECTYCASAHGAVASAHLQDPIVIKSVQETNRDLEGGEVSPKMKALLHIAALVQKSGKDVTGEAVEEARENGASDGDVHDTVLIAAAFCMFNRYVDGLGAEMPGDVAAFAKRGEEIARRGYAAMGENSEAVKG